MSELDAFSTLPSPLASAIRRHGFSELTQVQQAVLAPELSGKDLRVSSRTGSGKTIALGLVVGPLLIDLPKPVNAPASLCAHPRVLLVAPTRELAAQIGKELAWLYADLKISVCVAIGGTSVSGERRQLARGPAVVVGTPGRLCDHLERGALDLSQTAAIVLDEADQMLELGFREPLETLLGALSEECQRHLVSATFPRPVLALAARYQRKPVMVTGSAPEAAHEDIAHVAYLVHPRERYQALVNVLLMAPSERTLVFVRTRVDAAEVAARLAADGFRAGALSGELAQAERTRMLDAFRCGALAVLVCTDVASRGIDVPEIGRVIHAELPGAPEVLTHRSGRTGRAGRKGVSITLITPQEAFPAETLYARARIHAQLLPAPGQAEVLEETERRLYEELTEETAAEGDSTDGAQADANRASDAASTELASRLIEALGAQAAVERLLARIHQSGPTAPHALTTVPLRDPRNSGALCRRAKPATVEGDSCSLRISG
jgi:ATP-dependent RNA helicase DeaD